MTVSFTYLAAGDLPATSKPGVFVVTLPRGIKTKAELLTALATHLSFPEGFGHNWDALLDCLRDLSWIADQKVVLVHQDLPLADHRAEQDTYLEILQSVLDDWHNERESLHARAVSALPRYDHAFEVVLPAP